MYVANVQGTNECTIQFYRTIGEPFGVFVHLLIILISKTDYAIHLELFVRSRRTVFYIEVAFYGLIYEYRTTGK